MYNFWFAIENQAALLPLKRAIERREINSTWFPTARETRPFQKLLSAVSPATQADALLYASQRAPLPPASLTRKLPTLVSLDCNAAFNNKVLEEARRVQPAGFLVWSEWARKELIHQLKIEPSRVLMARYGVDLAGWDAARRNFEQARAHKTGLPERIRLLFVGDDFAGLGGEMLLNLLRGNPLLAEEVELHLVVNHKTAAQYLNPAFLPDYVQIQVYPYSSNEPSELYLNADILVLPSQKPISPALLAKAMSAGLPIIASRTGGLPELVQDGQNGILIEPGDQLGLLTALQRLIQDPALRYELGENSRKIAVAEFEASQNAHKILTFMKQLTAEARMRGKTRLTLAPAYIN